MPKKKGSYRIIEVLSIPGDTGISVEGCGTFFAGLTKKEDGKPGVVTHQVSAAVFNYSDHSVQAFDAVIAMLEFNGFQFVIHHF